MLRMLCRRVQGEARAFAGIRMRAVAVLLAGYVSLVSAAGAFAGLPDGRGYELVSPVEKNGVSPYAAVPSTGGGAVDFQARGAFAGAMLGGLNLYQARRTVGGWQTASLTPTPSTPLGALEEQVPVWFSLDLSQTIFTTPASYAPGDEDGGRMRSDPWPTPENQCGDSLPIWRP